MIDPNKIYLELVTTGKEWAEAQFLANQLEDATKPLLAKLTLDAMPRAGSVSAAEKTALASQPYREHITATNEAKRDMLIAKIKYNATERLCDLRRTVESSHRAAMSSAT